MTYVTSKDGTRIAYDRTGSGPALILVDGAMCSRAFGPSEKLASQLASRFTVYRYDRRGRNDSGDTTPYSSAREVEDIAALIAAAGGSASLLGLSSGAALALEAAASGRRLSRSSPTSRRTSTRAAPVMGTRTSVSWRASWQAGTAGAPSAIF